MLNIWTIAAENKKKVENYTHRYSHLYSVENHDEVQISLIIHVIHIGLTKLQTLVAIKTYVSFCCAV